MWPVKSICAAGMLVAASYGVDALAAPETFRAVYDVSRNEKPLGRLDNSLSKNADGSFEYVSRTEGTEGLAGFLSASVEERSTLTYGESGYSTVRYRYLRKMIGRKRERSLDIADGAATEVDDDERWQYRAPANVLDRHAVVLGLAEKLAAGAIKGSVLGVPVAMRGEATTWRFLVVGTETVETPAGRIDAIRVERMRENAARKTTSWHAPSFGYLPIKVEQTEPDGETMASVLRRFER